MRTRGTLEIRATLGPWETVRTRGHGDLRRSSVNNRNTGKLEWQWELGGHQNLGEVWKYGIVGSIQTLETRNTLGARGTLETRWALRNKVTPRTWKTVAPFTPGINMSPG